MAAYQKQNLHASKKKVSISFVIRDKVEKYHRSGVNSLQYDPYFERLYSAGRDSVIRVWNFKDHSQPINRQQKQQQPRNNHYNSHISRDGSNSSQNNHDYFLQSMQHHTDWVNDIILCNNGRNLISVSNDTTIKVWNAPHGCCLSTLKSHKDYAKCLAYAKEKEVVASAGFDRMIYLWDIQALTTLTVSNNTVTTKPLDRSKSSIYSLAINQAGNLIASGSTEKVIRLWDPRSRQKLLKLRGHTDNVRCLLFSKDGSQLLSGSSDGTIRLWSIPQQRCVAIIRVHDEGVWALQTNEAFTTVYSGGKDCKLFMTDLKYPSNNVLLCEESAPILKLLHVERNYSSKSLGSTDGPSLWIATTDSAIKNWSVSSERCTLAESNWTQVSQNCDHSQFIEADVTERPINQNPDVYIKGNPAIINFHILNDRRYVLTKESDNSIALYDVLTAKKVEQIKPPGNSEKVDEEFENEIKKRFKMVYVPNWFSVDLKIGMLCIHLDESECFSAWVSARDYGFTPNVEGQDPKINLGCLMLQALFEHWPPFYTNELCDTKDSARLQTVETPRKNGRFSNAQQPAGNQYFSVVSHTPIIISESNQTLFRFQAHEAESESMFLQDILPQWISDVVIKKCQPKFTKIPFFLLPHSNSGIKSLRKERLSASDMLQIRKVVEHICEKMMNNINEGNGNHSTQDRGNKVNDSGTEQSEGSFPLDKVELLCNEQVLDQNLDLRTVKHYIWKSGGDLVLHYIPVR